MEPHPLDPPPPRPQVWMRAIRFHTYRNRPIEVGDIYSCDAEIVETIEILKFAVRDTPPPRAKR